MTVVSMPRKNLDLHRIRTAMRKLEEASLTQIEVVRNYQASIKKLDQSVNKLGNSMDEYDSKLSNVKTKCNRTKSLMPDALALGSV